MCESVLIYVKREQTEQREPNERRVDGEQKLLRTGEGERGREERKTFPVEAREAVFSSLSLSVGPKASFLGVLSLPSASEIT